MDSSGSRAYSDAMREEQIRIPVKDSMVYARLWHAKAQARGLVLIIHGMAEHSLRYRNFALFLAHQGYHVAAFDLRGHGYTAVQSTLADDPLELSKQLQQSSEYGHIPATEGWYLYLDDLSHVLEYLFERYKGLPFLLFGHSMGSMIAMSALSLLPQRQIDGISGVILSALPADGGLMGKLGISLIESRIRRFGERLRDGFSDRLVLGSYSRSRWLRPLRTEQDWISSQPEEVDAYIADPFCGTVMSLGFYRSLVEGNRYIYSRNHRRGLGSSIVPVLFIGGGDDPVCARGKALRKAADSLRRAGWRELDVKVYEGGRHELLHDRMRSKVYDDVAAWLQHAVTGQSTAGLQE